MMTCPDDLRKKILESPILPKPCVEELLYTFDWREFVKGNLTGTKLQNHSFFFSFMIKKENGVAVFRAKKYPFNSEWTPAGGILLLNSNVEFSPVQASEFRLETLCLDKVYSDLYTKFFPTLETKERKRAEASWEKWRTVLENLPKQRKHLAPMRLLCLPKQVPASSSAVPSYMEPFLNIQTPDLIGQNCIVEPVESQFQSEILVGMDIAVYTESRKDRPWLGRVLGIQDGGQSFEVLWFKKKGRSSTFQSMKNKDGTGYTSVLPSDTVMLWEFSTNKEVDSFDVSKDWLGKIDEEYNSHDLCYNE